MMKIAKEFRWEMGHRLLCHTGKCKNLHGHSYRMQVEITSDELTNGMVMDYYDLKNIVQPYVDELDHCFIVNKNDELLLKAAEELKTKTVIVNFETTAENLCKYFIEKITSKGLPPHVTALKVKIFETSTSYAEEEITLR
jgi:6-pyruvoyltetrahydropterin/6-carboxytetrahydropterin synthase